MASANSGKPGMLSGLDQIRDLILPIGIVLSVIVIIVQLPTWLMNLLLSGNITVAVIILLTTIYVKTPLEFNVFRRYSSRRRSRGWF